MLTMVVSGALADVTAGTYYLKCNETGTYATYGIGYWGSEANLGTTGKEIMIEATDDGFYLRFVDKPSNCIAQNWWDSQCFSDGPSTVYTIAEVDGGITIATGANYLTYSYSDTYRVNNIVWGSTATVWTLCSPVNITFNYKYNSQDVGTVVKTYISGEKVTEAPACPNFYTANPISEFTVTEAKTVDVTVTGPAFPFESNKAYWLNAVGNKGVNDARYVTYNSEDDHINTIATTCASFDVNTWTFEPVANTLNQFYVKNGTGKYLNSNVDPANTTTTTCTLSDTKEAFAIVRSTSTGNNVENQYVGFCIQATTTDGKGAFVGAHVGTGSQKMTIGNISEAWFNNQLGCWHNSGATKNGSGNLFFVEAIDGTVLSAAAEMSRTTAKGGYGTICLPYNATATGATILACQGKNDDGQIVFDYATENATTDAESVTLEAGVPYLYRATEASQTFTRTAGAYADATKAAGAWQGSYTETELSENACILKDSKFYTVKNMDGESTTNVWVGAFKAYVTSWDNLEATSTGARACVFNLNGGETTGINGIVDATVAQKNGKFVENGRVVIVKNGKKFNVAGQAVK